MRNFEGDHAAVRLLAHQFTQQAEVLREKRRRLLSDIGAVQSGSDAWQGEGARAYVLQMENLIEELDRMSTAGHQMASVLYQVADRLYGLQELRNRLRYLEADLRDATSTVGEQYGYVDQVQVSRIQALIAESEHVRAMVRQYEQQYDVEAESGFVEIKNALPLPGRLQSVLKSLAQHLFDRQHLPFLVRPNAGHLRPGRVRVEYLNETIRMNQAVYLYYRSNPDALGPSGESAEEMMRQAHALAETARKEGGTFGVPIVFVHGLKGDQTTFQEMVDYMGGQSTLYTFDKKTGEMKTWPGDNKSEEHPVIQIVFEDGAMSFDKQVKSYKQMTATLKKDYQTEYMMVVSHSMGGVITTQYIEETGGADITRFVTLGSPITGSKADEWGHKVLGLSPVFGVLTAGYDLMNPAVHDLRSDSSAIHKIGKHKGQFNPDIEVFSAAGTGSGALGDNVVLPDSALALKDFAAKGNYSDKIYPTDTHSELHDDPLAIEDVMNFILHEERPKNEQ